MAMGELAGRRVPFMNVYAPANGAVRVSFFTQLLKMEVPAHVDVVCGGDFNCVEIEEIDRRGGHKQKQRRIQRDEAILPEVELSGCWRLSPAH
jgi:hypothetical protein